MVNQTRRQCLLGVSAIGAFSLAGCSSGPGSEKTPSSNGSTNDSQDDGDTPAEADESGKFATQGNNDALIDAPAEELLLSREALPGDGWSLSRESSENITYQRNLDEILDTVLFGASKRESVDEAKSQFNALLREVSISNSDYEVNIAVQSAAGIRPLTGGDFQTAFIVAFRDANAVGIVQWKKEGTEDPEVEFETVARLAVEMHRQWRE